VLFQYWLFNWLIVDVRAFAFPEQGFIAVLGGNQVLYTHLRITTKLISRRYTMTFMSFWLSLVRWRSRINQQIF